MNNEQITGVMGHRQRVRNHIEKTGLSSLPPHQVLEFLLFYGIPQKDTKSIAYRLMSQFGNLANILEAPIEALCEIPDMTRNAAVLLHSLPEIALLYGAKKLSARKVDNPKDIVAYVRSVTPTGEESLCLFCMDGSNNVLSVETIGCGVKEKVSTSTQKIVTSVMKSKATKIILTHNHPSDEVTPSQNDLKATRYLQSILSTMSIVLADHIIVGKNKAFSMHTGCLIEE